MPIPEPQDNESEQDYISRCMEWMAENNEFEGSENTQEQRSAVCYEQWQNRNDSMDKKLRIDSGRIDSYEYDEDEDTLTADVELTRSQVLPYRDDDGEVVKELLPPDELSEDSWLDSTKGKPVTEDHPPDPLNIESISEHSKGTLHDTPSIEELDDDQVSVQNKVTIFNDDLIRAIQDGKEQVSIGRKVDVYDESGEYKGDSYDRVQRNFRLNHLAVVDQGRAGPEVKLRMDGDMVEAKYDASKPSYNGTEDQDWSAIKKTFTAFKSALDIDGDKTWDDLTDSEATEIREHFIDQEGDTFSSLGYPVVNPNSNNLNRSAVANAKSRASAENDSAVESIANDIWDEEFAEEENDTGASISVKSTAKTDDNGDKPMKLTIGDKELELDVEDEDLQDEVEEFQDEIDERLHEIKEKDDTIEELKEDKEDEGENKLTKDEVQDLLEDREKQLTDAINKKMDIIREIEKVDASYEPDYEKDAVELQKDFLQKVDEGTELEDRSDGYVEAKFEMLLDSVKERQSKPVGDNSMIPDKEQRDDIADKKAKLQDPDFLKGDN